MGLSDDEEIGRIALRMHEMLAFDPWQTAPSPRCHDLARSAHAEMKLIESEKQAQRDQEAEYLCGFGTPYAP